MKAAITFVLAFAPAALIHVTVARRDRRRIERFVARRPIANRYAESNRVWR